jgi:tetratricopeptide (TPR) repeat protein
MAQLAVAESERSGAADVLGRASAALAEAYDWIGMAQAARDSFLRAEQLTEPWPAELAHIYFKHAEFLLDLGDPDDLETSLRYLDAAAATRDQAVAVGLGRQVSQLPLAIRLNRADALSQLGRLDAADRELVAAKRELGERPDAAQLSRIRLVEGYVAARRDDPVTAEALFAQADDGSLHGDYRWRIALELARSYRAAGHPDRAERAYRTAIAIIEQVRGSAAVVELRPWVLARRTPPYVELLALLVEQHRGVDALVVAESLHARAWLDVVLDHAAGRGTTAELALAAARIRQRLGAASAPPLDGASLMATIGDREALVFLTIGAVTWRAHIVHGAVAFTRLPVDTPELAHQFSAAPGDPVASARASAVLLPADLSGRGDTLYVIATGPLANVPFAALYWRGRYLIDQRPVARLPGLAALRSAPARWDQRMIFVGDSRGDLPEAAREVREVAAAMGASACVGSAASRQVLASARGARILHIAAHGIATSSGRAIVLADGNLTAADVLDAGLDPRLVVLSGCATAASDDAESWDGFPSAFLAAGSRYVVATLRSVEDPAAARVTEAYYAQSEAMNPIERLAAAQRQVSGTLPVAAWASFAAWGSPACDDDARRCSIPQPAASSGQHAIVRAAGAVQGRDPGALPRGPGALRRGGWGPRRGGAHP